MSETKSAPADHVPVTGESHEHTVDLKNYVRRCLLVFLAIACAISLMLVTSFSHISGGWPMKVTLILSIAIVNAFVVVSFLMHLLTEKKMVFTVLAFTIVFFAGLMGLTMWAMNDFPKGTAVH